jgi:transposase
VAGTSERVAVQITWAGGHTTHGQTIRPVARLEQLSSYPQQGKELLRAVYRAVGPATARAALDRFYRWCDGVQIPELSRLARTVRAWRPKSSPSTPPMAVPTAHRGLEPAHQKVKRVGHGFRNFTNYRLRLLLHCGVTWQTHRTARLRGRSPRLMA